MEEFSSTDPPASYVGIVPQKVKDAKQGGPVLSCDLFDVVLVHKIAQAFIPALATACVDNTTGDVFRSPGSVASDIRKEMVNYLTQRSESFVAESVANEGGPEAEASDHPYDIITSFIDEFAGSKRTMFSRVSGWVLSEKREDKIDDFGQELEINGFWPVVKRAEIVQNLMKNVDFKNAYHCGMKFESAEELALHLSTCGYRSMNCENEGCDDRFSANQTEKHDSVCPFKITPCEQNCSNSIMRREMDRHCITVCPMKLVNCPFHAVGCQSAIPQCKIDEHRSMDLHSHMLYILQGIYRKASLEDLQQRVEQLEKLYSCNLAECRDTRSLISKLKDLDANLGPLVDTAKNKKDEESTGTVAKLMETERKDSEPKPQSSEVNPNKDSEEARKTELEDSVVNSEKAPEDAEAKPASPEDATTNKDGEKAAETIVVNDSPEDDTMNDVGEKAAETIVNDSPENATLKKDDEKTAETIGNDSETTPSSPEDATKNEDDEKAAESIVNDSEAVSPPSLEVTPSNNFSEAVTEENSVKDVEGKLRIQKLIQ